MKHKFKPSVGGNRGKKGVPGGGRRAPSVECSQQSTGHASPFGVHTSLNESEDTRTAQCRAEPADMVMTEQGEERDEREVGESSTGVVEDISTREVQPTMPHAKTVPASSAGRVKRRVAPTVVSSRPRRSNTNCERPILERDPFVSTWSSDGANLTSSSDVVASDHSGIPRRATESVDHPTRHPQGLTNNLGEEMRREEMVSEAPDHSLDSQLEEAGESYTDDRNLSGMVRSSLDLVCPPPTSSEGATFELSRQERRLSPVCDNDEEEVVRDGGSQNNLSEGGGLEREGEDGEAEQGSTITREEPQNGRETKVSSRTRSRKRQSQSDQIDTTSQVTKKRKTGSSTNSRSPTKVRKAPDRASMTMQELIYYNPSANPMSSSLEEKKRKSQQTSASTVEANDSSSRVSTPAPPGSDVSSEVSSDAWGDSQDSGRIVPQLRMGKDGHIVLDEESMVVQATARPMAFDDPLNPPLIEGYGHTTSASYRKSSRVTRWTGEETTVFFRALSQVGTDFTMMTLLLPRRSRKELKNKFKKEERSNPLRVSQALKNQTPVRPKTADVQKTSVTTT